MPTTKSGSKRRAFSHLRQPSIFSVSSEGTEIHEIGLAKRLRSFWFFVLDIIICGMTVSSRGDDSCDVPGQLLFTGSFMSGKLGKSTRVPLSLCPCLRKPVSARPATYLWIVLLQTYRLSASLRLEGRHEPVLRSTNLLQINASNCLLPRGTPWASCTRSSQTKRLF